MKVATTNAGRSRVLSANLPSADPHRSDKPASLSRAIPMPCPTNGVHTTRRAHSHGSPSGLIKYTIAVSINRVEDREHVAGTAPNPDWRVVFRVSRTCPLEAKLNAILARPGIKESFPRMGHRQIPNPMIPWVVGHWRPHHNMRRTSLRALVARFGPSEGRSRLLELALPTAVVAFRLSAKATMKGLIPFATSSAQRDNVGLGRGVKDGGPRIDSS